MNIGIAIVSTLIVALPTPLHANEVWRVMSVTDGDTIVVKQGKNIERVRLIGIDAAELSHNGSVAQCYAREGTRDLKKILKDSPVLLMRDSISKNRDTYGRLLRMVSISSTPSISVNEQLVAQGSVKAYTRFAFASSVVFKEKQKLAQTKKLGIWNPSVCGKKR